MHNHEFVSRPSGSITCFICGLSASHDCHDITQLKPHEFVTDHNTTRFPNKGCFECGLPLSYDVHIKEKLSNGSTITAMALDEVDDCPYLTIMKGAGVYIVALVEWSDSLDSYTITQTSQPCKHKGDAVLKCADWARKDGLEIR